MAESVTSCKAIVQPNRKAVYVSAGILILCVALTVFFVQRLKKQNGYDGIAISNSAEISEQIRTALKNRSYRVTISFKAHTMAPDDIKSIVDELIEKALYESDDPTGGDYLRYQLGGYEMSYDVAKRFRGYEYTIQLKPTYYTTRDEEAYVDAEIERILESITSGGDDISVERRVRLVHDYVTDNVAYDRVHKSNTHSHGKTTAYAALKYHRAVCQGYAVLTYRLLKELGVSCRIVTGDAVIDGVTERHAWLTVDVDGEQLELDPTLDDTHESYDWYLKSAEEFERDHIRK